MKWSSNILTLDCDVFTGQRAASHHQTTPAKHAAATLLARNGCLILNFNIEIICEQASTW